MLSQTGPGPKTMTRYLVLNPTLEEAVSLISCLGYNKTLFSCIQYQMTANESQQIPKKKKGQ